MRSLVGTFLQETVLQVIIDNAGARLPIGTCMLTLPANTVCLCKCQSTVHLVVSALESQALIACIKVILATFLAGNSVNAEPNRFHVFTSCSEMLGEQCART